MAGKDERLVRLSEAEADRLARLYMEAELEILRELDRAMARGNSEVYLRSQLDNVQAILEDLLDGSRQWCEQAIPRIYTEGAGFADAQLKALGVSANIGFGAIHQQAVKVLADNTYQRLQDVAQVIGRRSEGLYRQYALETTRQSIIGHKTWKQVAREYQDRLRAKGVTGFRDATGREWNMKTYAEMVARTTTMEAHLTGTGNRLLENGRDLVKVSAHPNACEKCRPWEGKVLSLTGKTPGYPTLQEAKDAGLFHPRCFPAGVLVSGPMPLASMTRWYKGKLVVLKTAGGVELPVTPNHPILTPKGWVAAGTLKKGDHVVRYMGQQGMMQGTDPDDQQIPSRIEDVADTVGQSGCMTAYSVPVSPEDFHGDGADSQICIVRTNGLLRDSLNASIVQPLSQKRFGLALVLALGLLGFGPLNQLNFGGSPAPRRRVSSRRLGLAFLRGESLHRPTVSFGAARGRHDTRFPESLMNRHFGDPKISGNILLGFTGKIPADDFIRIEWDATGGPGFLKAANLNPSGEQDRFYRGFCNAKICSQPGKRLAGKIATDQIIGVEVRPFAGHVYNLQTLDGWYAANTIIAHNCEHAYGLYIDLDAEIEAAEKDGASAKPRRSKATPRQGVVTPENSHIPVSKLVDYALNREHSDGRDKAIAFERALGYNKTNYQDLMDNILRNLANYPAVFKGKNQYGEKYEVAMELTGPNGKTAKVLTAWLVDQDGKAKLVSVYVDRRV